jgi:hypothetical protein
MEQWEHYAVLLPWGIGVFHLEDLDQARAAFPGDAASQALWLVQFCAKALALQAKNCVELGEQYSDLGIEY